MGRVQRLLFLLRIVLRLPAVRDAGRFAAVFATTAACGHAVALFLLAPTTGDPGPLGPLSVGIVAAALGAAVLHVAAGRTLRRGQAGEFARLARRLGEEKTARSELGAALRRLSAAVERAVPEIFGQDDAREDEPPPRGGNGGGNGGSAGPESRVAGGPGSSDQEPWRARRLRRIARAAALFGGTDIELKQLALAGPCAEVIEEYRTLAGPDCEILYIEDGGGNWLSAPINRSLVVLMLRELLDNVLAHGGGWSRITVTTEPVSGAIVLRVRDDGRGIPPDLLSGVLSGSSAATRIGLGLPLVRAIVEAHGGTLRLESQAGHGTTATVRFPTHG